jgi:Do/DeqQ family serine protease
MDTQLTFTRRRLARAGTAVAAAALLTAGAAWHLSAATPAATPRPAAAPSAVAAPPVSRIGASGRDSYADIVKAVAPSVVTIHAEGRASVSPAQFQLPDDDLFRQFFGQRGGPNQNGPFRQGRPSRQRALGSGVVVGGDGYILTNNHVVDGADDVRVEFTDGRTLAANVVGKDKPSDLALLKVAASDLHPIALGNSTDVEVGDVVLAVGNPLGVGQTVTMGIVSAKGRSTGSGRGEVSYEDFLQTDAPINHGNSGGALVNTRGELIGINSQILSESGGNIGIGFAIPSNMAKHVMDDLRTKGRVTRAQLGVSVQGVTSDMAESLGLKDVTGAIIGSVAPASAADHAGLKRGDVIRAFNGQPVHDTNSLRNRVSEMAPGSVADVVIVRDGGEKHVSVKLDEASPEKTARREADTDGADKGALGVSVAPLSPESAARYRLPKDTHGVVVESVSPDGRAADAGIQAGDVIQEVNRQPVQGVDDLRAAVKKASERPLLLLVNRQGNDFFITVRPNG